MKPLNLDNKACSPISSNCVVWQGPDIPCIKLCTGDTVSDVISAMATELCTVLDALKVSNYDLTCFNLQACGPQDFQALIQFLIKKICENEGLTPATKDVPTCPDCVVSVAECFVTGTQTTMQLVDYVQLIGERVCSIITEISLINTQITDILIRVTTLENAPVPTFTIPSFTIGCQIGSLLSGTTQPIDTLLEEFINNVWCSFYAVTGSVTDLTNAINTQEPCITETSETISKPGATYPSEYPAWVADPNTVADSITNIWLVLCDLHTALAAGQTITVADTATIDLTLSGTEVLTADVTDTGWIDLLGFSYIQAAIAPARPRCRRIGNILYFKGTLTVPIATGSSGSPLQDGGGTAVILNTDVAYNNTLSGFVLNTVEATSSSDTDACLLKTSAYSNWNVGNEAIRCSFHRGNSCIPAGILNTGETLDDSGGNLTGNVIGTRFARTKTSLRDHCLSGIVRMSISSSGVLSMNSANFEDFFRGGGTSAAANGKSSMLRQFCSKAVEDQLIPQFDVTNVTSSIFGIDPASPPTPPYPAQLDSSATNTVNDVFGFNQDMSRADQIGGLQINLSNLQVIINQS
jgi:hypothetical protein